MAGWSSCDAWTPASRSSSAFVVTLPERSRTCSFIEPDPSTRISVW